MNKYPNDADGDALKRVEDDGSDMSKPMVVDFHIAVPNKVAAEKIAAQVKSLGYSSEIWQDEELGEWNCECSKAMLATYNEIVLCQKELDRVAKSHGGYTDGWGTFGNIEN